MEAATPLPFSSVHVRNGRLAIDSLVVDDQCVVRQAAERDDPERFVVEAIEIGARVLDREKAATDTDFVKLEFERTARELNQQFTERATKVADRLDQKVEEAFGAEHGHVAKVLARHFGDESTGAVQHRVKAVLDDVARTMREDLRKQLTSDTTDNPIVAIQRSSLKVIRDSTTAQNEALVAMTGKLEALKLQVTELRAEKQRLEDVSAAESRGTAKGRTYEEAVFEALDGVATSRGDGCEALGDLRGDDGRKGDVLVSVDACAGPARGRIVFEAKDVRSLPRRQALDYLDRSLGNRGADYAVLVMPSEGNLPARSNPLREINGNKLFVTYDPEEGSTLALEVAYSLARARVLMARDAGGGLDTGQVRAEVERAVGALEDTRRIKQQLTHAQNGVSGAREVLEAMEAGVKAHLTAIQALLDTEAAA